MFVYRFNVRSAIYLGLASIHLLIGSCHSFASYTIFQGFFDTNATTARVAAGGRMSYDGIEEIMPLSRAEIEGELSKKPILAPLTERSSITSLAKPKMKKRTETGKELVPEFAPYERFHIGLFGDASVEREKVPTAIKSQYFPTEFDDLTVPEAPKTINDLLEPDMEVTPPKSYVPRKHLHLKPDAYMSTIGPDKVENANTTVQEMKKINLSVSGLWHWMMGDDGATTSATNIPTTEVTTTMVATTTTQFFNVTSVTKPPPSTAEPPTTTTKFVCPERDAPTNIGPYEVPTEQDLVLFTKKILMSLFDSYHQRTFQFLRDIKEASKAAIAEDKSCAGNMRRMVYRQCLREISSHYEKHIKKLVNSLETDRHEIKAMTEGSVCSLSEMKKDPVHLIKTLAVEEMSLQFAFPGFLRLISSCRRFCVLPPHKKPKPEDDRRKKQRQNLEKEAMLKYMLTRNDYVKIRNKNRLIPKQIFPKITKQ